MEFTVEYFIGKTEMELKRWRNGVNEIKQGVFLYDDSMPKNCVNALYKNKVKVCNDVLNFLKSLDKKLVIQTNTGLTAEGARYYDLINR